MIPGPFIYRRPSTVAEAIAMLDAHGEEARPLAGGHSLIPMMKLRMAMPEMLVDLGRISGMRDISIDGGHAVIGAMATQSDLVRSQPLADVLPILRETALQIADPQIRAKGTLGGNVANGDPGNDMPAVMQCLGADYVLEGPRGSRTVAARDFYQAAYFTSLGEGEILTAIRIALPAPGHGFAYEKLKRKVGDYATAAAAVMLTVEDGRVATSAIALTNVGSTPLLAEEAASILVGTLADAETVKRSAAAAMAITEPATDGRGTARYRRAMAGVMTARAIAKAFASTVKGA